MASAQAARFYTPQQTLSPSGFTNYTLDLSTSQTFYISTTTNVYISTLTGGIPSQYFSLWVLQDAIGNRNVTWNTNQFKFPYGVQPTSTTNAAAYDLYEGRVMPSGTNAVISLQNWVR